MTVARAALGALWMSMVLSACGPAPAAPAQSAPVPAPAPDAAPVAAPPPAAPVRADRRIVILGDSLTAGLGVTPEQAYPAVLQTRLDRAYPGWTIVNAGVSGDTSAGGLRRLDWSLEGGAAILVVALGGNDALRGLPVDDLERNLDAIVRAATAAGARVIVAGMEAPPNNGPEYTRRFHAVYPAVATRHQATLVPFLLDGVAGEASLNQADGIHPNPDGARRVADTVWRALEPLVRDAESTTSR